MVSAGLRVGDGSIAINSILTIGQAEKNGDLNYETCVDGGTHH